MYKMETKKVKYIYNMDNVVVIIDIGHVKMLISFECTMKLYWNQMLMQFNERFIRTLKIAWQI